MAGRTPPPRTRRRTAAGLEFHLAEEAEDAQAIGLSEEQARRAARRDFGSMALAAEDTRAAWGWVLLDQAVQDLRYAVRTLARSPGFTLAAVLTLALGTGANTAIFSIVNAVMLRPLPYPHDDQLVRVLEHLPGSMQRDGKPGIFGAGEPGLRDVGGGSQLLSAVAAYDADMAMTLSNTPDEAVRLTGASATPSLFPLLGIQPSLGPGFREDDEDLRRTVVLSFATWQRHFASDANVVGRTVTLDGSTYRVAGVMPDGFAFPSRRTNFWVPLIPGIDANGGITDYEVIGRLKQGFSPDAASAEASSLLRGLQGIVSEQPAGHASYEVLRIKDDMVTPVRPALLVLLAGVGLLLLVACANVAHLVLARNASRQGEAAVRVALGAGRSRLVRQLLTESVILGLLGGTAGICIAAGGLQLLRLLGPADLPRLDEVQLDMTAFGFALALSALMGVLLGALPAWRVSRANPIISIKADAGARASRRDASRSALVVAEVATATMLLIGGGLLLRSFVKLANVNPGFDVERPAGLPGRAAARRCPGHSLDDERRVSRSARSVAWREVRGVRQHPAVTTAERHGTEIEGFPSTLQGRPDARIVSAAYPATMGIPLRQGHGFEKDRVSGQPMGVLVNDTLARAFGATVIGAPLTIARQPATIVGVVADARETGLERDVPPLVYMDARDSSLRMVRGGLGPRLGVLRGANTRGSTRISFPPSVACSTIWRPKRHWNSTWTAWTASSRGPSKSGDSTP